MTTFKHILATVLLATGLAFAAGCQSIPLDGSNNVGAFNYGEFEGLYNTTAPTVTQAVREAVKQAGLTEVAFNETKFNSTFVVRDADDLRVQIKVSEANSLQTKIAIRWGSGGDRDRSIQLYHAIEKILGGK